MDEEKEAERETSRIALLQEELLLAGVDLSAFFPAWAHPPVVRENVLRELLVALDAPIHEGRIPSYGSIIVPTGYALWRITPLKAKDLMLARKAADGNSALLLFEEKKLVGLHFIDPASAPDLELARLARRTNGVAILRDRNSVVRLYGAGCALQVAGRRWGVSPSLGDAIEKVARVAPMVDVGVLELVLEFAYYVLSPWRIGTTLVWFLSEDNRFTETGVDLRAMHLTIGPTAAVVPIAFAAHLLDQFDGAVIVSPDGRLLSTGIQLVASQKARDLIKELPGTRHTSALRASYDLPNALIVTVSADGPVTVFSDGVSILKLSWFSAQEQEASVRRALGIAIDPIESSGEQIVCPKCGKTSVVEATGAAGWSDTEVAHCPVCGEKIAEARHFIHANLRKVF